MTHSIHVAAPCRLHFGMFSFGYADRPQFGGVGLMIEPPSVELTITPASQFNAVGSHGGRVEQYVERAISSWRLPGKPPCEIRTAAPPDHVGLGVGTQLGLSVAAGLREFLNLSQLSLEKLAASVSRGGRSAVGTYGFHQGGLIVDAGKLPNQSLGTIANRVAVPNQWRFVLACPRHQHGLAGDFEASAFAQLPPVSLKVSHELWQIVEQEMLPAVSCADCAAFGNAVYHFGLLAGECFAAVQDGPFANPPTARLVDAIRAFGIPGVGQSSWGPIVFAVAKDTSEAAALANWLDSRSDLGDLDVTIAKPNNSGASINVVAV